MARMRPPLEDASQRPWPYSSFSKNEGVKDRIQHYHSPSHYGDGKGTMNLLSSFSAISRGRCLKKDKSNVIVSFVSRPPEGWTFFRYGLPAWQSCGGKVVALTRMWPWPSSPLLATCLRLLEKGCQWPWPSFSPSQKFSEGF